MINRVQSEMEKGGPDSMTEQGLSGFNVILVRPPDADASLADGVRAGLSERPQKTLPCFCLYDEPGSLLFEKITGLPEYYLSRLETEILKQVAVDIAILSETSLREAPEIVELGSGSCQKTGLILNACLQRYKMLTYIPVDINGKQVAQSVQALSDRFPGLSMLGLAGSYDDALGFLPAQCERLFLFLGSTFGNFSRAEQERFLQNLKKNMGPDSRLLLGYDIAPHAGKSIADIEAAYNDSAGVTEAFNRNVLVRLNRELGADFDLSFWRHQARFNQRESRIEMRLESLRAQQVHFDTLDFTVSFDAGETILTELSHKFVPEELMDWFGTSGFTTLKHWQDSAGWYGLLLLQG